MPIIKRLFGNNEVEKKPVSQEQLHGVSIIVASMGRCGSTMLYNAIRRCGFGKTEFLENLSGVGEFENGYVYKTHALPPVTLPDNVKLIYLFGNPMDIVISTNRRINWWGRAHHRHMGSDLYRENNEIFERDTLMLYRHFERWYRKQGFSFISIRYEALYSGNVRETLNNYLGFELQLPERRERSESWHEHAWKDQLLELYGGLHEQVEAADDVRIWMPGWTGGRR